MPRVIQSISALLQSGLVAAAIIAALSRPVAAQLTVPDRVETSGLRFISVEHQRQIDRGLQALAARQNEDGAFGVGRGYGRNVGVVALAGIAWLSSGSTPGRGPFGENINRATDFILSASRSSGYINVTEGQSHGPMYGHGFATLFLAEVYGMSPRPELREKLRRNEAV